MRDLFTARTAGGPKTIPDEGGFLDTIGRIAASGMGRIMEWADPAEALKKRGEYYSGVYLAQPGDTEDEILDKAINLYGAPPLKGKEFAAYRLRAKYHIL